MMRGWLALTFVFLASCHSTDTLTIATAASFRNAADCVDESTVAEDLKVQFHSGGSRTLAEQIKRGLPIDVFISASAAEVNLVKRHWAMDPVPLARNSLILMVPRSLNVHTIEDLSSPSIRRVALPAPELAPAGRLAWQAILEAQLENAMAKKIVFTKDVAHAQSLLKLQEVDAAFFYATDAQGFPGSNFSPVTLQPSTQSQVQVTAVVLETPNQRLASAWLRQLQTETACVQALGFTLP